MLDFELVSEFTPIMRRAFEVATLDVAGVNITNPNSANPLVLGEFLELNSSYQMVRGTVNGATVPAFAVFGERGRTDVQSLKKAPMLYLGPYEAQTKVYDSAGLTLGCALMVNDVTYGGLVRRGLKLHAGGAKIVGYCTRLPANNNNYLRFYRVD
jgi:hypothetical protein